MTLGASVILVQAFGAGHWFRVASLLLIMSFGLWGLVLVRKAGNKLGYIVLVSGAWLGSVGGLASGGGTTAPIAIVFPLLIVFAAWIGVGTVIVLFLATLAMFGGLAYAANNGLLPVRYEIPQYQALVVQSVILVGSLALSLYAAKSLRMRIERLTESQRMLSARLDELNEARSELQQLNASLEQQVEQRTAHLQEMVVGLESFNRNVSHDLRGSLGGIAGAARLADVALERGDAAIARRALPLIAEQAETSTRQMAALLALAQVGDARVQRREVDLRTLVEGVVQRLRTELTGQALPTIDVDELPTVNADPDMLQRVFANLIGNAIKFTRDAGESGRVEIGGVSLPGHVELYVRDNGIGFDATAVQTLFKPFSRLHGGQFEGHGVGLSIVRRAVERHGGRVWAEARPGQGATFRFSLPA